MSFDHIILILTVFATLCGGIVVTLIVAIFAVIKSYYVLPLRMDSFEKIHNQDLVLLAEKTKTTAADHDMLIRLDTWVNQRPK